MRSGGSNRRQHAPKPANYNISTLPRGGQVMLALIVNAYNRPSRYDRPSPIEASTIGNAAADQAKYSGG